MNQNLAEQNHWSERGRATLVANADALGRPGRSVLSFGGITLMSWRTGSSLFWDLWPKVKAGIPDEEHRAAFARDLVTLFLDHDVDPCDMRGGDPEIDRVMDEVDPEV